MLLTPDQEAIVRGSLEAGSRPGLRVHTMYQGSALSRCLQRPESRREKRKIRKDVVPRKVALIGPSRALKHKLYCRVSDLGAKGLIFVFSD